MKRTLFSILILSLIFLGCNPKKQRNISSTTELRKKQISKNYFEKIQAIDHWNFRFHKRYDDFTLEEQTAQIRANMDVASELGFNSYLLFQKDAFQELLTWGGKYSPDEELQNAVRKVIAYGKTKGLNLYLHSNQFQWPKEIGVRIQIPMRGNITFK